MATDESECREWQILCQTQERIGGAITDSIENFADYVIEGIERMVVTMTTMWVQFPTAAISGDSDPPARTPPGPAQWGVESVLEWAVWVSLGICVLSIITLGAMFALQSRRGEGGEHVKKIALVLVGVVLISGASAIITALLPYGARGTSDIVGFLQSSLWWYLAAAALLSVVIGSVKMAWEQRAEPAKDLVQSLMKLVLVAGAGTAAIGFLTSSADHFALWIIGESLDCAPEDDDCTGDFGKNITTMLVFAWGSGPVAMAGPLLVIVIGLCTIFFSIVQVILMMVRSGMLIILAGIFPLASSMTNTEMGKQWFTKCVGWLIAFILYKPAAAIVYATAFRLMDTDMFGASTDDEVMYDVLLGVTMMALAILAMPALMRFAVPMVAPLSGGGAGAALAGSALGALPSGAMRGGDSVAADSAGGGGASAPAPSGAQPTSPPEQTGTGAPPKTPPQQPEGSGSDSTDGQPPTDTTQRDPSEKPASPDAGQPSGANGQGNQPASPQPGAEQQQPAGPPGPGAAPTGSAPTGAGDATAGHPALIVAQQGSEAAQGAKDASGAAVDDNDGGGGPSGSQ